jgi:hypothetical protein
VLIYGYASPVINYANAPVRKQSNLDFSGMTRHRLVNRVIDDFVDKMVQPSLAG